MEVKFHNLDTLYETIHEIHNNLYTNINNNIDYLEKDYNVDVRGYKESLSSAQTFFFEIFGYPRSSLQNKSDMELIEKHLKGYATQLEDVFIQTYKKIISEKLNSLWSILPEGQTSAIKAQLAYEMKRQRISDANIPLEQKIEVFKQIISFIDGIHQKFHG